MQRRRRRQVPVSCQLCRTMKLKCDREQPCSNCSTRGVTCERVHAVPPSVQPALPNSTHNDVLARLQRLEDIVLRSHGADDRQNIPSASVTVVAPPSYISDGESDTRWLEGVGSREASIISGLSNRTSFSIISLERALPTIISGHSPGSNAGSGSTVMSVWLLPEDEATWLLERYTEYIAFVHHVVHIPSTRLILEGAYKRLSLGLSVVPGHVALLLSIFATTAYMLEPKTADSLFLNQANAISCAILWTKAALDILEYSRRNTHGSIEDVQATIILSFMIFNVEGFSPRFRAMSSNALIMAKDLSLHRIDADISRCKESPVQMEINRRIWWHLVATDWFLSLSGGSQQGTYSIHPKHMCVNHPRNIDDVDLEHPDLEYSLPLSQPTPMTYYILRIKLAEMSRIVIDTLPLSPSDWPTVSYDTIMSLDRRFDDFLRDLPIFFRHDEASRQQSRDVDRQYPQIIFQRYIIGSSFYSCRAKLNQPFLTRISMDERYSYSRNVCLQSARSIINMDKLISQDAGLLSSVHVRLATFLWTFFSATAVLVMDLCINKDEDNEGRRQEVMEACGVLKQAEETSPVAGQFLKSLINILHKYHIQVSPAVTPRPVPTGSCSHLSPATLYPTVPSTIDGNDMWPSYLEGMGNFDRMWQSFIDLGDSDVVTNWDDMFSALDARAL
ncbi:hypothetical protein BDV27DRAFT_135130 [Aspergillus caelatus]|uniref:Zn(2)-C6 fungal-type domain-containing protein n=1 Tax=Aspergillus caelatus TaxID=61420 RepID=A0A5N6ZR77_9EURO|nr:uncharacterized protein BDV27DRAFT_135130 [Aspergillus caelatus]KAE8360074.1 hypothetical protein BDV27DRAFT_135130 [Aspergillus caelatus]